MTSTEVDILAKSLVRVQRARDFYLTAKGKYKNPYWEPERPEIDLDLVVAIRDNEMVWTNAPPERAYKRESANYVMSWLNPPYPPIKCEVGIRLLPETIQLRTTVIKTITWSDDYSNEEAETILKEYNE